MSKIIKITKEQIARHHERQIKLEGQAKLDRLAGKKSEPIDFKAMKKRKEERDGLKPYYFKKTEYHNIRARLFVMQRGKKSLKNPTALLLYLLQWSGYENRRGRTGRWYKDGYIVASQSIEQMSVEFKVTERTIQRWIDTLVEDEIIVVMKDGLYNVYVLGLVDTDEEKHFFYSGDVTVQSIP